MSHRRRTTRIENISPVAHLVGEQQKTDVSGSICDDGIQTSDLKPIGHDHKKLRSRYTAIHVLIAFLDETDANTAGTSNFHKPLRSAASTINDDHIMIDSNAGTPVKEPDIIWPIGGADADSENAGKGLRQVRPRSVRRDLVSGWTAP